MSKTNTNPTPAAEPINSNDLREMLSKTVERATVEGNIALVYLCRSAWTALLNFELANREIERLQARIVESCNNLKPRRDTDSVDAGWVQIYTTDLMKEVNKRNAAHGEACRALNALRNNCTLLSCWYPDFNA